MVPQRKLARRVFLSEATLADARNVPGLYRLKGGRALVATDPDLARAVLGAPAIFQRASILGPAMTTHFGRSDPARGARPLAPLPPRALFAGIERLRPVVEALEHRLSLESGEVDIAPLLDHAAGAACLALWTGSDTREPDGAELLRLLRWIEAAQEAALPGGPPEDGEAVGSFAWNLDRAIAAHVGGDDLIGALVGTADGDLDLVRHRIGGALAVGVPVLSTVLSWSLDALARAPDRAAEATQAAHASVQPDAAALIALTPVHSVLSEVEAAHPAVSLVRCRAIDDGLIGMRPVWLGDDVFVDCAASGPVAPLPGDIRFVAGLLLAAALRARRYTAAAPAPMPRVGVFGRPAGGARLVLSSP
ncbi:MAG: hypothetical protein AAGA32_08145 [Pseudomonadota bacterium]